MSYNFPGLINPKRTAGRSSAVASSAFTPCAVTPARPDECRKILGRELSALQVYERETSETRNGPRRTRKNQESFPDELFLYPLAEVYANIWIHSGWADSLPGWADSTPVRIRTATVRTGI